MIHMYVVCASKFRKRHLTTLRGFHKKERTAYAKLLTLLTKNSAEVAQPWMPLSLGDRMFFV
jgi:transposase-like protein